MKAAEHIFKKHSLARSGFSLFEMLIVIAIFGIMASIGVGAFGGVRQGAVDQKDKRNAQEIASVAAIANAAGAQFVVPGDERASIENLRTGTTPAQGAFKGRLFKLTSMAEPEVIGAMRFLALNDTELQYRLDGTQ